MNSSTFFKILKEIQLTKGNQSCWWTVIVQGYEFVFNSWLIVRYQCVIGWWVNSSTFTLGTGASVAVVAVVVVVVVVVVIVVVVVVVVVSWPKQRWVAIAVVNRKVTSAWGILLFCLKTQWGQEPLVLWRACATLMWHFISRLRFRTNRHQTILCANHSYSWLHV